MFVAAAVSTETRGGLEPGLGLGLQAETRDELLRQRQDPEPDIVKFTDNVCSEQGITCTSHSTPSLSGLTSVLCQYILTVTDSESLIFQHTV